MTLEDFFTLTEMKSGLATLARVEELIAVMEKQKDCVTNNVCDAARQWSTVAGTISATENKGCLDHFVHFNGLYFLNQWLQEALKCSNDISDSTAEELINALLGSLERLPMDREKSNASGIRLTVAQLLCHKSVNIKERARMLSEKWNQSIVNDVGYHREGETCQDVQLKSADANTIDGSPCKAGTKEGSFGVENTWTDRSNVTRCSESSLSDTVNDVKNSASSQITNTSLNSADANALLGDMNSLGSSVVSNSCQENFSITEESSVRPAVGMASGTCSSSIARQRELDDQCDASALKDVDGAMEVEASTKEVDESYQDLSSNGCKLRKIDDPDSSFHMGSATDVEVSSEANLKLSKGVDIMPPDNFQKSGKINLTGEMDQKPESGLEYGEVDALEVARQVAIEVEREVVDYREPFCSSPDINSGESTGTEELNRDRSPSCKDLSDSASSPKVGSLRLPENIGNDPGKCEQDTELQQSTTAGQESDCKTERNKCDFDLNEDICVEEFDCSMNPIPNNTVNLSVPIAVSASKGAPVLPVAPLQFQGELGWKGSAATSAFRPASPRRTPDGEKAYSGLKQKINFLQIDLNVSASEEDVAIGPTSVKQMPVSSGFPSGDSSLEVSSRRGRPKLDLNRLGDEDVLPNPSTYWRRLHEQNGDQSLSPACSSSSSRLPSMRDFDLNDNPSFLGVGGSDNVDKSSSKASSTHGSSKLDDSDIMIMGSTMAVERKDYANGVQQLFVRNGRSPESATPMPPPYAHMSPSAYGYNGVVAGPFPPTIYHPGSIPYMVDSRGVTAIPQILGSAGLNGAHSATSPFLMGVTNGAASLNGIGCSRFGLDLNYDMGSTVESGSREEGSSKQFMQGHYGLMEAPGMAAPQPVISGMALKRKEPDCGWEPYASFGYKRVT